MQNPNIGKGLRKTPVDKRDKKFRHNRLFGSMNLSLLPENFYDPEYPKIKNQRDTDFCTGFASAAVSEDQEGVELSPEFPFAMAKEISGEDIETWGADLRTLCKVHKQIGAIEESESPYHVGEKPRDFLADPKNWQEVKQKAIKHQKKSFTPVHTGPYTAFDNIRVALWQHRDDHDKKSVFTGVDWFPSMDHVSGGLIPNRRFGTDKGDGNPAGHAIKIRWKGWKTIAGTVYLIIQNSWGDGVGDRGLYYIPAIPFNQLSASYGAFMFIDETPEDIQKKISLLSQLVNLLQQLLFILQKSGRDVLHALGL